MALYPGDYTKAVVTNWLVIGEVPGGHGWSRTIPHSVKRPLETRVWYDYPNRLSAHGAGLGTSPTKVARVLDDGTTQLTQAAYNAQGMVTSRTDPLGRTTTYTYAANGLDLLEVRQVNGGSTDLLASYANYTPQHLPQNVTDAAGQTTATTYSAAGQPLTVTNAKNETTTYAYHTNTGLLESVTGPVAGSTTTYSYDAHQRIRTVTEPDGYAVTTDYDALDRVTKRTYPDGTFDQYVYQRLDLVEERDRLGRMTRHFYDAAGRRTATRDPLGRVIRQEWCGCGSLDALVDGNGNRTRWERDVQGRVTREVRADSTTDTLYTYDGIGRLKTVTDPKDRVTTHTYLHDDGLSSTVYTNAQIATPTVSYTYDPVYPRVTTMVDGIGTTTYAYRPPGQLGAGQVASVDGPLVDDTIAYAYDELGRVTTRAITGAANTVTWTFDALGRVTSEGNVLGTFTYTYHGVTNRLATVTYRQRQPADEHPERDVDRPSHVR
jgi:YD repeat-containing protein